MGRGTVRTGFDGRSRAMYHPSFTLGVSHYLSVNRYKCVTILEQPGPMNHPLGPGNGIDMDDIPKQNTFQLKSVSIHT